MKYIVLIITLLVVNISSELQQTGFENNSNRFGSILKKLDEIQASNVNNAQSLQKQLSELKTKQENIEISANQLRTLFEMPVQPKIDLNNYSTVLQKVDENAATLQKVLSGQAEVIQQLKEPKESLQQLSQQVLNLVDTIQQLQQKQAATEEALNKNTESVRLLTDSLQQRNLGQQLISAVKDGDVEQVKALLTLGAPIEYQDFERNRPIHLAVINHQPKILATLLENKADIASKGKEEQTALSKAGYSNCVECARILLAKGAGIHSRDAFGNTPLIHPARVGYKEIVEMLLARGADINAARNDGWTGLHWAAWDGQLPIVQFLLEKGADPNVKRPDGKTPLDDAIARNHPLVADYLRSVSKTN